MKLAVFTVVMGEYDPAGVAAELAALGYDGVEWRAHPDFHVRPQTLPQAAGEVAALTRQAGLEVPSLGTYVRVDEVSYLEDCCRAAVAMGCPSVRIALREDYDGSQPYAEMLAQARQVLAGAEPLLRRYGVRGLLETHHASIVESASGTRRLLEGFSPEVFGVIFDPANMIIAGKESWPMAVDVLGEYLAHVHVKNISWRRDKAGAWQWHYDTLADGMVDWPEVIGALGRAGYEGYLSVEDLYGTALATTGFAGERIGGQEQKGPTTHDKLAQDLAYIRACLAGR